MTHEYINLDNYNDQAICKLDGITYIFTSVKEFVDATGFPYELGLLSWEPSRAHYVVERPGNPPTLGYGDAEPEMLWLTEYRNHILQCCITYEEGKPKPLGPNIRDVRGVKLWETDFVLKRHQEEQLMGIPTTLTQEVLSSVLQYRQALRDITKTYSDLSTVVWPQNPLE